MENKSSQEKAGSSRKSDVIILTPNELAKLGLIPELIKTSVDDQNASNETNSSNVREKQKRKSDVDNKYIIKNKEKAKFDVTLQKKVYKNKNHKSTNRKDVPQIKQEKSCAIISNSKTLNKKCEVLNTSAINVNSNLNKKLTLCSKDKKDLIIKSNEKKVEILKSDNKKREKQYISSNLASSSNDSKNFKSIEEFKQTLKKGLSKKLQEFDNSINYNIKIGVTKQNKNNTTKKLDIKTNIIVLKNAENLVKNNITNEIQSNLVDTNKGIKVTSNTSVHLSDVELKRLAFEAKFNSGEKLSLSKGNLIKLNVKDPEKNFEHNDSQILKDVGSEANNLEKKDESTHIQKTELPEERNVDYKNKDKNELDNCKTVEIAALPDTVNLITQNKEESNIKNNMLQTSKANNQEDYINNDKLTQNIDKEILKDSHMKESQRIVPTEEENTLKRTSKPSANIPKKRKYVTNFTLEDKIMPTEKILENYVELTDDQLIKNNEPNDTNSETEIEENCPKKQRRMSEIIIYDTLPKQEKSKDVSKMSSSEIKNEICDKRESKKSKTDENCELELPIQSLQEISKESLSNVTVNNISDFNIKSSKKRGRPKKIVSVIDDLVSPSTADVENIKEVTNSEHSKRGIDMSNELPDICTKLPKKRGRPKKNLTIEENTSLNIADIEKNNESEADINVEQIVSSTPLPKKRGRKKKSEQQEAVTPEVENNIELDESKGGRKRRKINYLELANEAEENVDGEQKRKYRLSIQNAEKVKINRQESDDQIDKDSLSKTSEIENEQIKADESTKDSSTHEKDEDHLTEDKKNENKKKSKYRKTGDTTMMMNSIFAAAFKKNPVSETEDSNISSEASSSNILSMKANKQGRKKKSATNIIIDKDNMVTCVACNEKVDNDFWIEHNRQEHNNLAWRDGEQELKLDNALVVAKILKPVLEEDNVIKCKKCNNSFKKVNGFTNHMEKCNGVISSSGMVTCAVCKTEMEKTKWPNHKQRQHNNLAWRNGDRPLNLNDQSLVVNILTALYKAKKPLYCEKCGISKKSVVGFLSHQSQCGVQIEEVKVQCQFCEKKVLPVSMASHIKMVHETPKEKNVLQDVSYFSINGDTSKQRKAAKRAMLVINKISSEKMIQEHSKYFLGQVNFSEEDFVETLLKKELSNNSIIKCKFNNCSYESDSVISVIEHLNSCKEKPEQYYTCKKCFSISATEEDMKVHLKNIHDIDIIDDEYQANDEQEDFDDEMMDQYYLEMKRGSLHERSKMEKDPHYKVKPTFILNLARRPRALFSQAYNYTMSFCEQNYSKEGLFKTLRYVKSDWLLLNDNLVGEYLPPYAQSCGVARRKVANNENVLGDEYTFKKFDLFENECDEGIITIFCGGPIQAMAWMPSPYTSLESKQVLAVAPINDFDKKYLVNLHYNDQSVIQFWDFGILKNKHPITEPKLMFCLAHDFGPVWHMEWCPSGCYDPKSEDDSEEMLRMGLLAAAGSNSVVYIYSVPHLKDEQMGVVYKTKPLLKLHLGFNEEYSLNRQKFYATKISWSKASDHRYIAVGYTDGVVALFDLNITSNVLRCKNKDGCEILLPFRSFQAHTHMVTVVDLIHLAGGKRWLLTGSFDRNITIWDLSNNFKISSKRNILTDGLWLTNWLGFLSTADESSTKHSAIPTLLASYRDYLYEHVNLTSSSSSVKTISESTWLNGIIYCSTLGEITAMFPAQLLFGVDNDKKLKSYIYSFGYTKLINKRLTPEETIAQVEEKNLLPDNKATAVAVENSSFAGYKPVTYQETSEKYGLLFCDAKMDSYDDFGKEEKKTRLNADEEELKAHSYPMQAINKVAFNPNLQASLYYATGYQAGFVRVTYMKFLEKDLQIK